MVKKRVSLIHEYGRFLVIPVAIVALINVWQIIGDETIRNFIKFLVPIIGVIITILVFQITKLYSRRSIVVKFDESEICYSRYQHSEIIRLESVVSLKMTTTHFMSRYQFKLDFLDAKGELKSIKFFPRFFYTYLDEFGKAILKANPKAEVQKVYKGPFYIEKSRN